MYSGLAMLEDDFNTSSPREAAASRAASGVSATLPQGTFIPAYISREFGLASSSAPGVGMLQYLGQKPLCLVLVDAQIPGLRFEYERKSSITRHSKRIEEQLAGRCWGRYGS